MSALSNSGHRNRLISDFLSSLGYEETSSAILTYGRFPPVTRREHPENLNLDG